MLTYVHVKPLQKTHHFLGWLDQGSLFHPLCSLPPTVLSFYNNSNNKKKSFNWEIASCLERLGRSIWRGSRLTYNLPKGMEKATADSWVSQHPAQSRWMMRSVNRHWWGVCTVTGVTWGTQTTPLRIAGPWPLGALTRSSDLCLPPACSGSHPSHHVPSLRCSFLQTCKLSGRASLPPAVRQWGAELTHLTKATQTGRRRAGDVALHL